MFESLLGALRERRPSGGKKTTVTVEAVARSFIEEGRCSNFTTASYPELGPEFGKMFELPA